MQRKRQKDLKIQRVDDAKKTLSFRHDRADAEVNSQRLWQRAQSLHRFKPDQISARSRGAEHGALFLTKKPFTTNACRAGRTGFLQCSGTGYVSQVPGFVSYPTVE